jgi:outer membrane protein TolC
MKPSILFLLISWLLNNNSFGASLTARSLNLEGALSEGRSHSPKLQIALAQSREARWKKFESLSGFLPQVSISGSHFFNYQFQTASEVLGPLGNVTIPFIYPITSFSFDAKLPIFDGFKNVFQYQAASIAQEAAEDDAEWVQYQVEQDVRIKFYQALAAEKLASVADQNLRTLEDHIKKVNIRRSGGVATRYDVLRVEVQLDEAQSDKIASDDNVIVAKQKLFESLGIENEDRSVQGDLPAPNISYLQGLKIDNAYQYLGQRKDIIAMARRVDSADRKQAAAANFWVPLISAGYDYTYYNNVDTTLSTPYASAYSLGVFLTWNIFDGGVSLARHKESAEQTRQVELGLRTAQLKFKSDFEYWRRQYIYNARLYEAKVADVGKSQEAVRLAEEGYRAGVRTTSETLDAELDLFRARAGAVRAQLSAAEALSQLEVVIGRKI